MLPILLTANETARSLGLTKRSVTRLVANGHLQGQRYGGTGMLLIPIEEVKRFARRSVGRPIIHGKRSKFKVNGSNNAR